MGKKLLIDATHAEETRVVVLDGTKVEDFDFETIHKRQLAGNIYLAKVTRVEPSLQAAFVDYGGNRHGFLAFAEIHPDYYQIPVADRQALLEEERALVRAQDEDENGGNGRSGRRGGRRRGRSDNDASRTDEARSDAAADAVEAEAAEDHAGAAADTAAEAVAVVSNAAPGGDAAVSSADAAGPEAEAPAEGRAAQAGTLQTESTRAEDAGLRPARVAAGMDIVDVDGADDADEDGDDAVAQPGRHAPRDLADASDLDSHGENEGDGEEAEPYRAADHATELDAQIESVADEDVSDEVRPPRRPRAKRYKIQEVIKVRQIMLVQVVKEERGNKGAALTTYLSLAGRYCVLMPNTGRGGGISRKITNVADRKKLKEIAAEMEVPEGAGLIIRTAGAQRTKAEIRRDYEYLFRLWEQIRDLTLKSIAPAPIYEEGDLIKRSIRDLYNKDIDEVLVEGEAGYRAARDFMKMIMPSHAKNVKPYSDPMPLFARHQVESYLTGMFNPTVQLKSGGYIVIGVTEALVAIDINSGKATRQGSIEETALQTNLEAADEIARQLRLRDLAGLIVIDFIDMEERRNNAAVEKRLKDALRNDRARIQVGRISGFGLLEMSRQRLRPGMLEATTQPCPHCHGTGLIRSDNSIALAILRALEEEGVRKRSREVLLRAPVGVVNYLFNHKREHLAQIEARYDMAIRLEGDPSLISPDYSLEKFKTATRQVRALPVVSLDAQTMSGVDDDLIEDEVDSDDVAVVEAEAESKVTAGSETDDDARNDDGEGGRRKRRRRRRRRGGDASSDEGAAEGAEMPAEQAAGTSGKSEVIPASAPAEVAIPEGDTTAAEAVAAVDGAEAPAAEADATPEKPKRKRRSRARKSDAEGAEGAADATALSEPASDEAEPKEAAKPAKPRRTRRKTAAKTAEPEAPAEAAEPPVTVAPEVSSPDASADQAPEQAPEQAAQQVPAETSSEPAPSEPAPSEPVAATAAAGPDPVTRDTAEQVTPTADTPTADTPPAVAASEPPEAETAAATAVSPASEQPVPAEAAASDKGDMVQTPQTPEMADAEAEDESGDKPRRAGWWARRR